MPKRPSGSQLPRSAALPALPDSDSDADTDSAHGYESEATQGFHDVKTSEQILYTWRMFTKQYMSEDPDLLSRTEIELEDIVEDIAEVIGDNVSSEYFIPVVALGALLLVGLLVS